MDSGKPCCGPHHRRDSVPGANDNEMPLEKCIDAIHSKLTECIDLCIGKSPMGILMVEAATGSGKSVVLPAMIQKYMEQVTCESRKYRKRDYSRGDRKHHWPRKLLVLNPSTIDIRNVCKAAIDRDVPSCFRMGHKCRGREPGGVKRSSKIVFATVGIAAKWYACHGAEYFDEFGGVICDEMHKMESDVRYALLWELFLNIRQHRDFVLVGATATFSEQMTTQLRHLNCKWVHCTERRWPLQRFTVKVRNRELYPAIAYTVRQLILRHQTCLVFLPGKQEIKEVTALLVNAGGVHPTQVSELHAELNEDEKIRAMSAQAILSTSIAETSITLPELDHVLDAGLSRTTKKWLVDVETMQTLPAPLSVINQRAGRAGRAKPGCATLFVSDNGEVLEESRLPIAIDEIQTALAFQQHYTIIRADALSMCPLETEQIASARQQLEELKLTDAQQLHVLKILPFSFRDAAAFFRGMQYNVAFEVAALLIFKNMYKWDRTKQYSVDQIVQEITGKDPVERIAGDTSHNRGNRAELTDARDEFDDLRQKLNLSPSSYGKEWVDEAVAVAMLIHPERLVWQSQEKGQACFLGEPLVNPPDKDGEYVAVLFSKAWNKSGLRLHCSMFLPCTEWVKQQTNLPKLSHTAKCLTDSTLGEFRRTCILALREKGFDTKFWWCKPGTEESNFASKILCSLKVHFAIIIPNGNRLAKEKDASKELKWIDKTAREMATALHMTSQDAAIFVGNARLSPGVRNPQTYGRLVPMLQRSLEKENLAVVKDAPGIEHTEDGMHWSVSSEEAVKELIKRMVDERKHTLDCTNQHQPILWCWCYDELQKRHFPYCIPCGKFINPGHIEGKQHKERCHGLPFTFTDQERWCTQGARFREASGDEIGSDKLKTTKWLDALTPLPAINTSVLSDIPKIKQVLIREQTGEVIFRHKVLPKKFVIEVWYTDNRDVYGETYEYLDNGSHRVVYINTTQGGRVIAQDEPVEKRTVIKMNFLDPSSHWDNNLREWNAIITNAELSNLVPKTYGYAQAKLYNHDVSLLFVDFLGLTLKNMFEEMTQERPGERELQLIALTSKSVMEMLVNSSNNMLQSHDWHFGNIAFENKSTEDSTKLTGLKLIDWEGNGMANAQQTERGRMRHAFDAFRNGFMEFEEKGYIKSDDKSVKSIWSSAMQIMGEVLGTWWTPWNKVTGEDIESPLPNDENLQDLADRLNNAVEDLTQQLAMPTTKMKQRTRMPWRSGGKR